jgi:hypothetical protein
MISSYDSFKTEVLRELSKMKEVRTIQTRILCLYQMVYPFYVPAETIAKLNGEQGTIASLLTKPGVNISIDSKNKKTIGMKLSPH